MYLIAWDPQFVFRFTNLRNVGRILFDILDDFSNTSEASRNDNIGSRYRNDTIRIPLFVMINLIIVTASGRKVIWFC